MRASRDQVCSEITRNERATRESTKGSLDSEYPLTSPCRLPHVTHAKLPADFIPNARSEKRPTRTRNATLQRSVLARHCFTKDVSARGDPSRRYIGRSLASVSPTPRQTPRVFCGLRYPCSPFFPSSHPCLFLVVSRLPGFLPETGPHVGRPGRTAERVSAFLFPPFHDPRGL